MKYIFLVFFSFVIISCNLSTESEQQPIKSVESPVIVQYPMIPLSQEELSNILRNTEVIRPMTKGVVFNILTEDEVEFWSSTEAGTLMLFFTASWCGPCKAYSPVFEEFALSHSENVCIFGKTDVDKAESLVRKLGITSVPATMVIKGGEVKALLYGILSKSLLKELVQKYCPNA